MFLWFGLSLCWCCDCVNHIFKVKAFSPVWRMPKVPLAGVDNPVRDGVFVTP